MIKEYSSLEELKKDYPIGKIEIQIGRTEFSCDYNNELWGHFEKAVLNNPLKINEIKTETGVIVVISPLKTIYNVIDHIYSVQENKWYPVIEEFSGLLRILDDIMLPYNEVLKVYKDYIYSNTVEQ